MATLVLRPPALVKSHRSGRQPAGRGANPGPNQPEIAFFPGRSVFFRRGCGIRGRRERLCQPIHLHIIWINLIEFGLTDRSTSCKVVYKLTLNRESETMATTKKATKKATKKPAAKKAAKKPAAKKATKKPAKKAAKKATKKPAKKATKKATKKPAAAPASA